MAEAELELEGVEDAFPITAAQSGMLYHSLADPDSGVYIGVCCADLPAELDFDCFDRAWRLVVARHQALRSLFVWEGLDVPVHVVRQEAGIEWESLPEDSLEDIGESGGGDQLIEKLRREGLDLSSAPVMRFILCPLGNGGQRLIWICHHALMDAWSQAVVLEEVEIAYRALAGGNEPRLPAAMPYRDFVDWIAGRDTSAEESFWRDMFAGYTEPTRLQLESGERARAQGEAYGVLHHQLDHAATGALTELAANLRVTPGSVVNAVWSVVLHRLAGSDDVSYGQAATQRPADLRGIDRAVGNFVTTLPARSRLDQHETFRELVMACHQNMLDAQSWNTISLLRMQDICALPHETPLFDSIISVRQENFTGVGAEDAEPLFGNISASDRSNYTLAIIVTLGEKLELDILYSRSRYSEETAGLIASMLEAAFRAAPDCLALAPYDVPVMPADAAAAALAGDVSPITLPDSAPVTVAFANQAERQPDAPALVTRDDTLSYRQMHAAAESLARRILDYGIAPQSRVAIFLDRGARVPVAMFASLIAGCAYVPLDVEHAATRIDELLAGADVAAILTDQANAGRFAGSGLPIIDIDAADSGAGVTALALPEPEDIAYVMFTSGSTGKPKGVVISHANLSASTAARPAWYREQPARFLLLSSFSFDSSVAGIFWTLTEGGTLVIPPRGAERDVSLIASLIGEHKITHTLCLPGLYQLLLDSAPGQLLSLRTVIVAGEEIPAALAQAHARLLPKTRLINEYGPTETTVWCTVEDLGQHAAGEAVAIGEPIPGTRAILRDQRGRPVPDGLPGELYIGGPGVAVGYFEMREETESRFVPDPVNPAAKIYRTGDLVRRRHGKYYFLGRGDSQVKIRGHRVELAEVENALAVRPDIREVAVAATGAGGHNILVAYLVARAEFNLDREEIAEHLARSLPAYMIPARFVLLDSLPRLPNGKIDRKALPEPDRVGERQYIAPSTSMEAILADIWRRVLWSERDVGINEDFFELGGHSLLSMKLVNELEQTLNIKVPLSSLGRITTIAEQAVLLERLASESDRHEPKPPEAGADRNMANLFPGFTEDEKSKLKSFTESWPGVPARAGSNIRILNENGSLPPLFFCFLDDYSFRQLALHLGPDQPVYGIRGGNAVIRTSDEAQQQIDQRRVAINYLPEVLDLIGDEPVFLGGYCQGATVVLNIAAQLIALQKPVATVMLVEKTPPISFPGRVNIIFGRDSFLNPYLHFDNPEKIWDRRYGTHSLDFVSGPYLKVFQPPHIYDFARVVRERLAEARAAVPVVLPKDGYSVEWLSAPAPAVVAPGAVLSIPISLRNSGKRTWHPTRDSGLRVQACWYGTRGEPLRTERGRSDLNSAVEPGEDVDLLMQIAAPPDAGPCVLRIDMVEEGVAHFSKWSGNALEFSLVVDPDAELQIQSGSTAVAVAAGPEDFPDLAGIVRNRLRREHADSQVPVESGDLRALTGETVEILLQLAYQHLERRRFTAANACLIAAKRLDPAHADVLLALGRLRLSQYRVIEAFLLLSKAKRTARDDAGRRTAELLLQRMNLPLRLYRKIKTLWQRNSGLTDASKQTDRDYREE